jgi:hypothetical protein
MPCYKEFGFDPTESENSDWESKSNVSEFQLKLSYLTMIITKNFANKILKFLEKKDQPGYLPEDGLQDFQQEYLTRYNEG